MDNLKKVIWFFSLFWLSSSVFAAYPASIRPMTYCHVANVNSYSCSGPVFGSPQDAAKYSCQNTGSGPGATAQDVLPMPGGQNGAGLTTWGAYHWKHTCISGGGGISYFTSRVQALPDCGTNVPVVNYAPAMCTGEPPPPPPVACTNTRMVVISAYHATPAILVGCYAGCTYNATDVRITEYNATQYESGTWTGTGELCAVADAGLIGGSPGNSQNVGGGGGLVPGDLQNLATEQTLQQVLETIRLGDLNSGTVANSNNVLLQQIAASTAASVAGGGESTSVPDPDGFEAEYEAKLAATQVDGEGKLPEGTIPTSTVDVGNTFSNVTGFIGSSACPVPPSFSVKGQTYSFDMSIICGLAEGLSYLVVALASIAGVKIFVGGMS